MHTPRNLRIPARLSILAFALSPALALAAGTATVEGKATKDSSSIKIMWQDDGTMRINTDPKTPSNYMIIKGDKMYTVFRSEGKPKVMEMSGMLKAFGAMAKQSSEGEQAIPERIESVKATGESETIAGIKGNVYQITVVNTDGTTKTQEAVLSDDPRTTELTGIYMTTMLSLFSEDDPAQLLNALPSDERGLLRFGEDFHLTSISGEAPDASQFELPAKPTSLADMMQSLQKSMKK